MSYITPTKYWEISEELGKAYASLRDSLNDTTLADASEKTTEAGGSSATAYAYAKYVAELITESTDDNDDGLTHDLSIDPPASIANDLGTEALTFGSKFADTAAKNLAASQFSSTIQKLNAHVVKRTKSATAETVNNISQYFDAFRLVSGSAEMSLHSNDGVSVDTNYYFSQDFDELCDELNIDLGAWVKP